MGNGIRRNRPSSKLLTVIEPEETRPATESSVRKLIIVSGPPGAGKTTIAVPLAERLGFRLIAKDHIKEGLDDLLNPVERDVDWSRLLGRLTYEIMWAIAPNFEHLILESNFYRAQIPRIMALNSDPIELFCSCPAALARSRYQNRAHSRHPVHVEHDLSLERYSEWDHPLGLSTVIEVDMAEDVDIDKLARQIEQALQVQ